MSRQTLIAVLACSVVNTLQTLARGAIAIAHRIGIDIAVAVAALAGLHLAQKSSGIAIESIAALLTAGAEVADGALRADDCVAVDLQAGAIVGARAALAVVGGAAQGIAIVTLGALIAVVALCVVLTDAATRLRVTDVRVAVAVAGYARHEGSSTRGTVTVTWRTRLTELSQVALGAGTLLDPGGRLTCGATMRRLQLHIIQIRFTLHRVGCSDLNGRQIGQYGEETTCRLTWLPLIVVMLVQTERVLPDSVIGYAIALGKDR